MIEQSIINNEIEKWRYTMIGGAEYLLKYIKPYDKRESPEDFEFRLSMAVCAAHAKKSLTKIKNSMYQRFTAIERSGLSHSQADNVVTKTNQSMNDFIGNEVLLECLSMQTVGVYVDMPKLNSTIVRDKPIPYLYVYKREDILDVSRTGGKITAVKLRTKKNELDEFGFSKGLKTVERVLHLRKDGVHVFDDELWVNTLKLKSVPFVLFDIKTSLLTDIADYQLAMTNLSSTDISFCMRGNFPIYTEQFDMKTALTQNAIDAASGSKTAKTREIGTMNGVAYPTSHDRPGFISPQTDCLMASMKKQEALKLDIDELVNNTLMDLGSADGTSPESGLAYIAGVLEAGELEIAKIWAEYERKTLPELSIRYPRSYALKTDEEIRKGVQELRKILPEVPSKGFQKALMGDIMDQMYGHKVSPSVMRKWKKEIADLKVIKTDPQIIRDDYEAGLVGTATASVLLGYEIGEAEIAKKDHADRLATIALAQSSIQDRGVRDTGNPDDGKVDKKVDKALEKDQRGKGKSNGDS